MRAADRLAKIQPSVIRAVSAGAPPDSIPLGLGEPGWPLPSVAYRAMGDDSGGMGYPPGTGWAPLRQAVAEWHGASPEEVLITSGTEGAIFGLIMGHINPGEAILVPEYGFPAYETCVWMAGGERFTFGLGGRAALEADKFIAALDEHPNVRMAFINHPGNPTGGGCNVEELRRVAQACEERDVILVSDEVYRDLYFGERPPSLRDVTDKGVVLHTMSKGWAGPGLRVGWCVGDPEVLRPADIVHSFAVTSASLPAQRASLALLENSDTVLPASRAEVHARWEALADAARTHLGIDPVAPAGSFYWWVELPEHEGTGMDFCLKVRDEGRVTIIPGVAFGEAGDNFARISFGARPEVVAEGIKRLAPFWGRA